MDQMKSQVNDKKKNLKTNKNRIKNKKTGGGSPRVVRSKPV